MRTDEAGVEILQGIANLVEDVAGYGEAWTRALEQRVVFLFSILGIGRFLYALLQL